MNAAPCSWRVSTKRMRESASESRMSRISSPGRPNTYWTPSFSRHLTIRSDAFTALGDPDRLDVHELPDAVFGQLAEQRRRIECPLPGRNLATQEQAGAAADGFLDLTVQRVAQVDARLRPNLGVARERIANAPSAELLDESR